MFLALVLCGYALGILHKVIYNLDYVLILYLFNFSMVLTELCLCLHYRKGLFPGIASGITAERYKLTGSELVALSVVPKP